MPDRSNPPAACHQDDEQQNLSVNVSFDTFLYPLSGSWKGRRYAVAHALSSSHVSFFCQDALEVGETMEFVVPITAQPLILRCRILQAIAQEENSPTLYKAEFTDLCTEEESLVREAVFAVQLRSRNT